ncbi:MLP-like protein [Trifolium pratense]|uniref:MLP-like protein n=1 Tax=Trifolium pratense TaxID=57577 RepID=A0A2K3LSA2_TRIPR|nr:MLP-like protein [Trifolium pratense]
MVLVGKLSTELGIKTSADKFFKLFASEIHELQNICGSVHETNLHEGDEWHHSDSVKHWTHILGDGGATVKWTVEYEKINEDIDPPYGWLEYVGKCTRDIDAHFLKQAASVAP